MVRFDIAISPAEQLLGSSPWLFILLGAVVVAAVVILVVCLKRKKK